MGQILIRDLDDALLTDYRRAAEANGRSLEAELREALAAARPKLRLSGEAFLSWSRDLRALTPASAQASDSTDVIRTARDVR